MQFKDFQIIGFSVLTCTAVIYQLNSLFPPQTVVVLLDTVNYRDRTGHTSKANCQELADRQSSSLVINSQSTPDLSQALIRVSALNHSDDIDKNFKVTHLQTEIKTCLRSTEIEI